TLESPACQFRGGTLRRVPHRARPGDEGCLRGAGEPRHRAGVPRWAPPLHRQLGGGGPVLSPRRAGRRHRGWDAADGRAPHAAARLPPPPRDIREPAGGRDPGARPHHSLQEQGDVAPPVHDDRDPGNSPRRDLAGDPRRVLLPHGRRHRSGLSGLGARHGRARLMDGESRILGACPLGCADTGRWVAHGTEGSAAAVQGDPTHPFTRGVLCNKLDDFVAYTQSPERLLYPMRRVGPKGAGDFERISWDGALDEIAGRLSRVIREFGAEAIWPYLGSGSMGLLQGVYGAGRRLWNVV